MFVGYGIINKGDVIDMFPYISPGNNIPEGIGWVKKVENCKNRSTTIPVKLTDDGLFYHNIPLKYVTKVDILTRIHIDTKECKQCSPFWMR